MIRVEDAPRHKGGLSKYTMPTVYGFCFLSYSCGLVVQAQRQFADIQTSGPNYQYFIESVWPTSGFRIIT